MAKLVDQTTDKTLSFLYNIIKESDNKDLVNVISDIEIDYEGFKDLPSGKYAYVDKKVFPVTDSDNVILSKIYFDFQKDEIPDEVKNDVEDKINTYLDIYEVPDSLFDYQINQDKTASDTEVSKSEPVYLLPSVGLFKVSNTNDLEKCASAFEKSRHKFLVTQKMEFANNFIKTAREQGYEDIPNFLLTYTGVASSNMDKLAEYVYLRSLKATKHKEDYEKLAQDLQIVTDYTKDDLYKVAELIYSYDRENGFDRTLYNKHIPDALESVFNKTAAEGPEESEDETSIDNDKDGSKSKIDITTLSKSDIIGRYGEDVLDEVLDEDGEIDYEALKDYEKAKSAFAERSPQ